MQPSAHTRRNSNWMRVDWSNDRNHAVYYSCPVFAHFICLRQSVICFGLDLCFLFLNSLSSFPLKKHHGSQCNALPARIFQFHRLENLVASFSFITMNIIYDIIVLPLHGNGHVTRCFGLPFSPNSISPYNMRTYIFSKQSPANNLRIFHRRNHSYKVYSDLPRNTHNMLLPLPIDTKG